MGFGQRVRQVCDRTQEVIRRNTPDTIRGVHDLAQDSQNEVQNGRAAHHQLEGRIQGKEEAQLASGARGVLLARAGQPGVQIPRLAENQDGPSALAQA